MMAATAAAPRLAGRNASALALRATAIAGLVGAEIIHISVIPLHFQEWVLSAWFFAVLAALEGALAVGLIFVPSRLVTRTAIAVSVATVAVWVVSRTAGLPFGPGAWVAGPIGRSDAISTLLEIVTAWALLGQARTVRGRAALKTGHRGDLALIGAVVIGVGMLTTAAVLAPAHATASHAGSVSSFFIRFAR
jgi:hypothetical protein